MENQSTVQTVGVIVAVVVIGLGLWYFFTKSPNTGSQTPAEQAQTVPTTGNTTADISTDLNQVPDSSAGLDADASASSQDIQSL